MDRFRLEAAIYRKGKFRRMSDTEIADRIRRFVQCIESVGLVPIASGVNPEIFMKMKKMLPKKVFRPTLHFSLAVNLMTHLCGYLRDLGLEPKVNLLFDRQTRLEGPLRKEVVSAARDESWILHGMIQDAPVFRDDKECLPLQAADCLVWSYRKQMHSRLLNSDLKYELPFDIDRPVSETGQKGPGFFAVHTEDEVLRAQNEILRLTGVETRFLKKDASR